MTSIERQQRRRARLREDEPLMRSRERGQRVRALAAEYDLSRTTVYRTLEAASEWHDLDLHGRPARSVGGLTSKPVYPRRRPDETLAEYHARSLAERREYAEDAHAEWQARRRRWAGITLKRKLGDVSRRASHALYQRLRVELHEAALAELGLSPEDLAQLDARVQAGIANRKWLGAEIELPPVDD